MTYVFVFGMLFGLRHALDADHIVAVATLATRSRTVGESMRIGLAWGAGHAFTLLAVCAFVLFTGAGISEGISQILEALVGVMLVGLGADVLRRARKQRLHVHLHAHENDHRHFHVHSHAANEDHNPAAHRHTHGPAHGPDPVSGHEANMGLRAGMVGLMHGLAGSAALVILAVGSADSLLSGFLYVGMFGIGSMLGMAILSLVIAVPFRFRRNGVAVGFGRFGIIAGLASMALGGFIIYENSASIYTFIG
jgi:ABC-type nickel/cobalt efflux system permease component RcnA